MIFFFIFYSPFSFFFFFFNDTATTEIYTLSLHDALPISCGPRRRGDLHVEAKLAQAVQGRRQRSAHEIGRAHVELQSQSNLVCRLLLEKKKKLTSRQTKNIVAE